MSCIILGLLFERLSVRVFPPVSHFLTCLRFCESWRKFQLILLCNILIKEDFLKCLACSFRQLIFKYISKRRELPFWLGFVEHGIHHYISTLLIPKNFFQAAFWLHAFQVLLLPHCPRASGAGGEGVRGHVSFHGASSGPEPASPYTTWVGTGTIDMDALTHQKGKR